MLLIYLSGAWVAGIFLGSKFNLPLVSLLIGLIPLPLLFFTRQYRKLILLASLCLLILFGGTLYFRSSLPGPEENGLQFYNDSGTLEIKGLIDKDPELGDKTTYLYLAAKEINVDKEWHKISGNAQLLVPRYPTYSYGDWLLARGKLETPPHFNGFNYKDYLAHQEIYSLMIYPKIEILERGRGSKLLAGIYSLRNRLYQALAKILPEPQASLAQGIILGLRGNIPPLLKTDFVNTGTAHLLAISGQNLTIVTGILLSLGIWLFGKRGYIYIWLALATIWLYALLTGMHPPVVRAVIMASLFLAAELLGRQRSAATALAFAAAIMVGVSPQVLWDAAFQMSFMAIVGLIFLFPLLQKVGRKAVTDTLGEDSIVVPVANLLIDSFSVTLGAILAVWPLIAYYFGVISWMAPLATFFALPALPGIIISGALAGGLGLVFLPIAQVVAWLAWLFLSYLLLVVKVFAIIPSSTVERSMLITPLIWAYYLALTLIIWFPSHRQRVIDSLAKAADFASRLPKKWVIPPLAIIAVLVSITAVTILDNNLRISFLDVGQGDAILIQRGSQQILVDGGPSPRALDLALGKKMPFWDRTIDLVILTHPHDDHITGLVEVLHRYKVEQVLYPDVAHPSTLYSEWFRLLKEKKIESTLAQAGQQINWGGVMIEVLNPSKPLLTKADIDGNAVVLRLKMDRVSFLLTADITKETELELTTRRANLASTILKVGHHGSATATTDEFLAVVAPQFAAISVGKDNPFGHPSVEVLERLTQKLGQENIYRTDEHGTIEFITDGEKLWVRVAK